MKCFVTGGTGLLGLELCRQLVRSGHHVTALVRSQPNCLDFFGDAQLTQLVGDLEAVGMLDIPQVDVVIHAAAELRPSDKSAYYETNSAGTRKLVDSLVNSGRTPDHFVYTSSLAAFDVVMHPEIDDPYGQSKLEGERHASVLDCPVTILRIGAIYQKNDPILKSIRDFLKQWTIAFYLKPDADWGYVHVVDLVDLIMNVIQQKTAGVYPVCLEAAATTESLLREGFQSLHRKPVLIPVPSNFLVIAIRVLTFLAARRTLNVINQTVSRFGRSVFEDPRMTMDVFDWYPERSLSYIYQEIQENE